ncbi:hypothetical protein HMPREF1484_01984 [Dermabacter sp. HFH0086]|uniref:phage major capsid protein n=1 Tax=Dermabacter TaxID=36739 RepID=UPI0003536CFD|nr:MULTISPECIES: Mu-like prophage major head subunit gpT family protein [Dermabacter]EPH14675.1 hypothetical protein HMPREF1484_01984 [Dermabacter sp. HFH0086]
MSNKQILEAYRLFDRASSGDYRAKADMVESLTTSDFPQLLGRGFNTKLAAAYQALTPVWSQYSTRTTVQNFKPQTYKQLLGYNGLELVPEATEYPAGDFSETKFEFQARKYGRRLGLTYEMIVNDELGAFRNIHDTLAQAARDLEGTATADALLNGKRTDVNTDFFKAANGNAPESAALTRKSLQEAIETVSQKRDVNGRPLVRPNLVLVVPPALEFQAREIVNASQIRRTDGDTEVTSANILAGAVTVVVDPNLMRSTHAKASKTWFLLPAPNTARPALVTAFMSGHETPDLRYKNDQGNRVGGGSIPVGEGSFDDDTIQYRVRHIVGAAAIDPTFTFVSRGN